MKPREIYQIVVHLVHLELAVEKVSDFEHFVLLGKHLVTAFQVLGFGVLWLMLRCMRLHR